MASLYRKGQNWYAEGRCGGVRWRRSLKTRDREIAEMRLAKIERDQAMAELTGEPGSVATATRKPDDILIEYVRELERRGRTREHATHTYVRCQALLLGAATWRDVTPEFIRLALGRATAAARLAPKTVNAYRAGLHGLCAWLVREGRWPSNPVEAVATVRVLGPRKPRRALTDDELTRLIQCAPQERAVVYLLAATSGLRRGTLEQLLWSDVDLGRGCLTIRPEVVKNRKHATLPLPWETVEALGACEPKAGAVCPVVPTVATFYADLAAAGIERVTAAGKLDLHALRTTYITRLALAGVGLVQAQQLAGHSTPDLTANTYTRLTGDAARAAVDTLPRLLA